MAKQLNENVGCLSIFVPFLEKLNLVQDTQGKKKKPLPYRLRDDFLTTAEFSFYKVLENLLGSRLKIQSKVRMADIFFVIRPKENHRSYFPRISQKHLDFLVCDAKTMQPVFGVELDDSSHKNAKRQKRDRFVDDVFEAAKLPLLHVPTQRQYNSREIAEQIRPLLKDYIQANSHQPNPNQAEKVPAPSPTPTPKVIPVSTPTSYSTPLCPKCGTPMVVRTVSKGDHKGKQFYGCSNYPKCRQMKPFESSSS